MSYFTEKKKGGGRGWGGEIPSGQLTVALSSLKILTFSREALPVKDGA